MYAVERTRPDARSMARVPSGATLEERRERDGGTIVELRAPDGGLIVEYRPAEGTCRIHARAVQLCAEDDLSLSAGRRVQIEAAEGVVLRSGESAVSVDPRAIAQRAETVETEASRLVQRVAELETHARRLVERTRESFREIEELAQTKAGRLRLVAEETVRVLGRQTFFKAREDMKLRGERIYLE